MIIPEELYQEIVRSMPIPCVDLRVTDPEGRVLLVRRRNAPAQGEWWFPGGRIHFGEWRPEAVKRKLQEECGLAPLSIQEVGTFDLFLEVPNGAGLSHGITTLFRVDVASHPTLSLDEQSEMAEWRLPSKWLEETLHPLVAEHVRDS